MLVLVLELVLVLVLRHSGELDWEAARAALACLRGRAAKHRLSVTRDMRTGGCHGYRGHEALCRGRRRAERGCE